MDKPGKRKKLDATARAGSEDKDAGIYTLSLDLSKFSLPYNGNIMGKTLKEA